MTADQLALQALRALVREEARAEVQRLLGERQSEPDALLTTMEAAERAKVAPRTIRRWIKQGRLVRYQAGREIRIKATELDAFLRAGRRKPSDELTDAEIDALVARKTT